jgi:hypothetical protein
MKETTSLFGSIRIRPEQLTPEQIRRMKEARADGVLLEDIARRFGVNRDWVSRVVKAP